MFGFDVPGAQNPHPKSTCQWIALRSHDNWDVSPELGDERMCPCWQFKTIYQHCFFRLLHPLADPPPPHGISLTARVRKERLALFLGRHYTGWDEFPPHCSACSTGWWSERPLPCYGDADETAFQSPGSSFDQRNQKCIGEVDMQRVGSSIVVSGSRPEQ